MHIAFDAKRIFFNRSGLGNYSRSTVDLLARHAPENTYTLFSPSRNARVAYTPADGVTTVYPTAPAAWFPSLWRSCAMHRSIRKVHPDVYHGLSNELPLDIRKARVKSVVTMHDLIFLQHPELYKPLDVRMYTAKYRRSCEAADCIIAVSRETARALTDCWNIPEERIRVVYQGCHPQFLERTSEADCTRVRRAWNLPERYLLNVGTLEARKNLLLIVKALLHPALQDTHLVACGRPTPYLDEVRQFIAAHHLEQRVHLIHGVAFGDLPAIYQMSDVFIYPSFFEGFGIPIVEALSSQVPVITTRGGVFGETGGDACRYVDPNDADNLAQEILEILSDSNLREEMKRKGLEHIRQFAEPVIAQNLNNLYHQL